MLSDTSAWADHWVCVEEHGVGEGVAVITWCQTTQGQHVPSMGERTGGVKWHRHASFTSLQQGDSRSLVHTQSIVLGLKMGTLNCKYIRWAQFALIKISQNCLIIVNCWWLKSREFCYQICCTKQSCSIRDRTSSGDMLAASYQQLAPLSRVSPRCSPQLPEPRSRSQLVTKLSLALDLEGVTQCPQFSIIVIHTSYMQWLWSIFERNMR